MSNDRAQDSPLSGKIMVVDDEPPVRTLFKSMLERLGYQVAAAADGQQAWEQIAAAPPDVVLTDITMPVMDGFELCRRIKSNEDTRMIPVVMVTALSDIADRVKAMELGADDFLSKPVHHTELQARVRSLLKVKAYHDHMKSYQQQLEKEVARKTHELRLAFEKIKSASLDTIHRLARAAEYRDEDTGAHIQRLSHGAAAVARQLGLQGAVVESLLYAVPMHDVGKIGVPDRILLKPGKLDPEEWEIMKQHTTIGAAILEGSTTGFLKLAEVVALTHHEKWDGSGYPRGLAGNAIPLAGRITAIVDVFDALTSKRPYKDPFPVDKALAIIEEGRGNHFDPKVVDAFFAAKEEILAIKARFKDEGESLLMRMARAPA